MKYNEQIYSYYLGHIEKAYIGYSADPDIRDSAASGGFVSSILIHLLEKRIINAAVVSKCILRKGKLTEQTILATNREEILSCQTSIYFDFPLLSRELLESIRQSDGKIAVVGLPCDITRLKQICEKDNELADKIILTIGLFCGHNSKKELISRVLKRENISQNNLKHFTFRKGLWRGKCHAVLTDGTEISFPFQRFSTYQNMHVLSATKCFYCSDHTAENADISTGDVWLNTMKKKKVKHSIFAYRSKTGKYFLQKTISSGILNCKETDLKTVFLSNKRALIYHKAIRARSLAGQSIGRFVKVLDNSPAARWNEIIAAYMVVVIWRICQAENGKKVLFFIPRKIIWCYLAFFKLLTNF